MIKVDITRKSDNVIAWSAIWPDSNSAQAWIDSQVTNNSWGKPDRIITPNSNGDLVDIDGTFLQAINALSSQLITDVPAVSAINASYSGVPSGCNTSITISADVGGAAGNALLPANGVKTIAQLISDWNTTNPSNTLTLTSGDDTQVPTAAIMLSGGVDTIPAVTHMEYTFPSEYSITQTDITLDQALNPDWIRFREQRDRLLRECDWTQSTDSPLTAALKTSYATYRQALRDLPANTVDPNNPTWPVKP